MEDLPDSRVLYVGASHGDCAVSSINPSSRGCESVRSSSMHVRLYKIIDLELIALLTAIQLNIMTHHESPERKPFLLNSWTFDERLEKTREEEARSGGCQEEVHLAETLIRSLRLLCVVTLLHHAAINSRKTIDGWKKVTSEVESRFFIFFFVQPRPPPPV